MAGDAVAWAARYWAFVSYSHRDAAFGRRLHRRLEAYALPRRLVGRGTARGAVPRRIHPIFRDREEFAAAHDLSAEVRAALEASASLVVVCSPAAAASAWVAREIDLFKALHPDRPVLAALVSGEPAEAMPAGLRTGAGGAPVEPLAADFRRGRDGEQLALLKLVAGIVGIGLDELVQRDGHRRLQRVTAVTAAALVAMLGMGALTLFALNARAEAERQRAGGEGLVRFMYTDLRDGLRGVGRLDLMAAVNARALAYYDKERDNLQPASQAQRARILQAIGEDDETKGRRDDALKNFQEAWRTTSALLAADPDNPDRIFDEAQSAYWLGYDAYERGEFAAAKTRFLDYKRLADRLVVIDAKNPRYGLEQSFAEGDLCSLAFKPPKDRAAALSNCLAALHHMEAAVRRLPPSTLLESELANRHSWLGDAYRLNGDDADAVAQWTMQERTLDALIRAEPQNMMFRSAWIAAQRSLARADAEAGRTEAARERLQHAIAALDDMIAFEPGNKSWIEQKARIESDLAKMTATMTGSGIANERKMK